ncbi:MAG TPA: sugar ABC transporter permease [Actinomycetota bacterium]|nr:sugar ABC transporter permease [Actinomycetota bacterium]
MSGKAPVEAVRAETTPPAPRAPRTRGRWGVALLFLLPALVLLGALVVYPIFATVVFSFQGPTGRGFVGLDNYQRMFSDPRILRAIRNNVIWVVFVPALVTAIGLVFAVLTERVSYGRAFKTAVFMPMAISLLAGGVIWRLVYEENPERGLLNAGARAAASALRPPGPYVGATPSEGVRLLGDGSMALVGPVRTGTPLTVGVVGLGADSTPPEAREAGLPSVGASTVGGVVYRDFTPGGGGTRGALDPGELGLPEMRVEVRDASGEALDAALTDERGRFTIELDDSPSRLELVLPASNFRPAFEGIQWLGPTLITPAIIVAYIWIWAGFAMVVIGAGLAAISREVLEAARVDGASEWQIFRRITVPLLAPVLGVVLVTLVINVLKVFDIVLVIAPSVVRDEANVIALEMYQQAFGARNFGLGAAVAVLLFVLVVPVIALNVKRFRQEQG